MRIVPMRLFERDIFANSQSVFVGLKFHQVVQDVLPLGKQGIIELMFIVDVDKCLAGPTQQRDSEVDVLAVTTRVLW